MYCYFASPTVTNVTLWNNSASETGGGLQCYDGVPYLTNCTLVDNTSAGEGSGVGCVNNSAPTLDNTIIAFNGNGGSVYCEDGSGVTLNCSDVYGNTGGDWIACIQSQDGVNGNIGMDPLFCDRAIGDFLLHEDSPCAPFASPNPECDLIGAWPVGCGPSTSVSEDGIHLTTVYLAPGAPNPSSLTTRIEYVVPSHKDGRSVTLKVYDAAGRKILGLVDASQPTGRYSLTWDGTDQAGQAVASGVYFYRLTIGRESVTRQVALMR